MPYERKTKDEYQILGTYDNGVTWDIETTENSFKDARRTLTDYIVNVPTASYRIKKVRIKKEN